MKFIFLVFAAIVWIEMAQVDGKKMSFTQIDC